MEVKLLKSLSRRKASVTRRNLSCAALLSFGAVGLSTSALADSTIFSDNFTETILGAPWKVLTGQCTYTVGGGKLQYFNQGPLSGPQVWSTTALSLGVPFTGTNWRLSTEVSYHLNYLDSGGGSSGAQRHKLS